MSAVLSEAHSLEHSGVLNWAEYAEQEDDPKPWLQSWTWQRRTYSPSCSSWDIPERWLWVPALIWAMVVNEVVMPLPRKVFLADLRLTPRCFQQWWCGVPTSARGWSLWEIPKASESLLALCYPGPPSSTPVPPDVLVKKTNRYRKDAHGAAPSCNTSWCKLLQGAGWKTGRWLFTR